MGTPVPLREYLDSLMAGDPLPPNHPKACRQPPDVSSSHLDYQDWLERDYRPYWEPIDQREARAMQLFLKRAAKGTVKVRAYRHLGTDMQRQWYSEEYSVHQEWIPASFFAEGDITVGYPGGTTVLHHRPSPHRPHMFNAPWRSPEVGASIPMHRPADTGYDDSPWVAEMERLLKAGICRSRTKAAERVVAENKVAGNSDEARVKRLVLKHGQRPLEG